MIVVDATLPGGICAKTMLSNIEVLPVIPELGVSNYKQK